MVGRLHDHYGIRDPRVLEAMRTVPRHLFVPEALQSRAYGDHALPISANQTIAGKDTDAWRAAILDPENWLTAFIGPERETALSVKL